MAAEYTPPYTNLAVLLQDIGLKVRSIYYGEPELYGLPEEITVPEFWDQYNHFHVKIRYDENGEKMKTRISRLIPSPSPAPSSIWISPTFKLILGKLFWRE